jgi:tetratricopeptide (TPR) repeat protein
LCVRRHAPCKTLRCQQCDRPGPCPERALRDVGKSAKGIPERTRNEAISVGVATKDSRNTGQSPNGTPRAVRLLLASSLVVTGILLLSSLPVFADGKVSGKVTSSDGSPLADITLALKPEAKGTVRLTSKTNKKGEYFFGIVRNGQYSLELNGPVEVNGKQFVPYSIKLSVYDTENRKSVLDYQGAPPTSPQIFDVADSLKVNYDLVLGDRDNSPAAIAERAAQTKAEIGEIPKLLQSGDFQGAVAKADEALKTTTGDPMLHYWKGYALFRMSDYNGAKASLDQARAINPDLPGLHMITGGVFAAMGQKADAVAEFQKELAISTDQPIQVNLQLSIGRAQKDLGHRDEAIAAFERALDLDSSQQEAYAQLSDLYTQAGSKDKLDALLAREKTMGIADAKEIFNIGANYWNAKDFTKAEEYFQKATDVDPTFSLAWKQLGYAKVRLGKVPEAVAAMKKYLELEPKADDAGDIKQMLEALSGH